MKHSIKIVTLLLLMFIVTQLIGLVVINIYSQHGDNLPYGMEPPKNIQPESSLASIVFAVIFAVVLMLLLMRYRVELILKLWFLVVIIFALGISLNAFLMGFQNSALIAAAIAIPLALLKVFWRGTLIHNFTELLIYPGIASIFVPLLNIPTVVILLILISVYDIYAVWHSGFMQKMAKYQIQNIKVFSGFFIPYLGPKERRLVEQAQKSKSKKMKLRRIKVSLAILGGGDVVFPIILAGVVLRAWGIVPALIVSAGAAIALATLFYFSKKGKFYPAMPFISAGCFIALGLVYLLKLLAVF